MDSVILFILLIYRFRDFINSFFSVKLLDDVFQITYRDIEFVGLLRIIALQTVYDIINQ